MAEIFAAELRADAERLRHLENFLLHLQIAEGVGNVFGMRGRGINGRIDRFLTESERGVHAASLKGIQRCAVGRVRELATLRMAWVNGWRSCSRMLSAMAEAASGRSACFKACCMEFRSAES
jgi:hypothetical protein